MADTRAYVAGFFMFNLDGVKCGFIKSIDGGAITAEVVTDAAGPTYFVAKHLSKPKYEDFTMQIGLSMGKPVYEWIKASWEGNYQRKNGAIVAANHKLEGMSTREFYNALVTETTFPALDGASKDAGYLTLKFAPEWTRVKPGDGKKVQGEYGTGQQKQWQPYNFRLEIDGLDCTRVNKIDSFTVKQTANDDAAGQAREHAKEPGKLEFPNLKITLSEVTSKTWYDWHEDFLIKGNNSQDKEKGGRIVFLSSNGQTELGSVTLFNLGIFKLTHDKNEAAGDAIKRVTAELYCERMTCDISNQIG